MWLFFELLKLLMIESYWDEGTRQQFISDDLCFENKWMMVRRRLLGA